MRKKTEEKRQAIIGAAFEVFSEVGFEQASMSEIAARVGGSKATLYGYFESKEEMFFEVMNECAAQEIKGVFALLKTSVPIRDALTGFGKHYLIAILKPQLLAIRRLAIHEGGRSHVGALFYERGPKLGWQMVTSFLQQCCDSGRLRTCNVTVATAHLRALFEAELVDLCILGVQVDTSSRNITQVVNRALDVFMAAYGGNTDKE